MTPRYGIGIFIRFALVLINLSCLSFACKNSQVKNPAELLNGCISNELLDGSHHASYCNGFLYKELNKKDVFVFWIGDFYDNWRDSKTALTDTLVYALKFKTSEERQYKFCSDVDYLNLASGALLEFKAGSKIDPAFCRLDSATIRVTLTIEKANFVAGLDSITLSDEFFWIDLKTEQLLSRN